jgi:DHA1 family solute carrier family 18 vesicular amine transporter 1/2
VGSIGKLRVLGVVGYALFMDYLIYGLIVPLTPYSPAGAMSEDRLALLYGCYALGVLAATPLFGYLGERIGYRQVMIVGVLLAGCAIPLFWLAPNFLLLLLARLFQGAAAAATWTTGLALMAEHYTEHRVRMMGYALVGSTAGSIAGPILGGGLYSLGGYSLPFAVVAGLVFLDFLLRVFALPVDRPSSQELPDLRSLLLDKSVLVPALAVALAAFGWGIVEPLLPTSLEGAGASAAEVGLLFTIATVAYGLCAPLVGWASERLPIRWVIIGGVVGMALSLGALGHLHGVLRTGIGLCILSAAFAFTLNPTSAELGNAVDRRGMSCYAAVYAVYNIAYSVGMMATNALATAAAAWLGYTQILTAAGIALLICVPLLLLKDRRAEPVQA